jgi:transposase-like protein
MGKTKFTNEYKANLVIESIRAESSISQIAEREGVSRIELHGWKKEFMDNVERPFTVRQDEKQIKKLKKEFKNREDELTKQIEGLEADIEWLQSVIGGNIKKKELAKIAQVDGDLNLRRRCELLGINRARVYYVSKKKKVSKDEE